MRKHGIFSDKVHLALIVLEVLGRENFLRKGMTLQDLAKECRVSARQLRHFLYVLRESNLVHYDVGGNNGKFYAADELSGMRLYDLIKRIEGEVRLGNFELNDVDIVSTDISHEEQAWEERLRKQVRSCLKEIKLSEVIAARSLKTSMVG